MIVIISCRRIIVIVIISCRRIIVIVIISCRGIINIGRHRTSPSLQSQKFWQLSLAGKVDYYSASKVFDLLFDVLVFVVVVVMLMTVMGCDSPGQGKKPFALEQFFEGWGSSEDADDHYDMVLNKINQWQ